MKAIFWNARRVANHETRLVIQRMININKPDFLFIGEPSISPAQFPERFWHDLDMKLFVVNNRGSLNPNLWCICK